MKLYLSSYRVPTPQDLQVLVGKKPADTKMAIIPNAKDYYSQIPWALKTKEMVSYFKALGYEPDLLDLREYSSQNDIIQKLKGYDLLWLSGGNTFVLRYEIRRSGLEACIKDLLNDGLVLGGESAGALVAGHTIKGAEYADVPQFAPEIIWDGLNLVPFFVMPHIDSKDFGDAIQRGLDEHSNEKNVIMLKDSQAYIVDGEEGCIVTSE